MNDAALVSSLLEATLAVSAAVLLVLLLRMPVRRLFGARAARALWWVVLLAPLATLLPAPVQEIQHMTSAPITAPTAAALSMPVMNPRTGITSDTLLVCAWLLGALLLVIATWWRQRKFMRRLGTLVSDGAGHWRAQTPHGTPALVGVVSPRIVLPSDFDTRYNASEQALVLAHERAHRAAGDTWINMIAAGVRCVFWFNPLVHIAASRLRLDQELACDAIVAAQHPRQRRVYAEALLKTEHGSLLPIGCQWRAGDALTARVRALASPLPARDLRIAGIACAGVIAIAGGTVAWAVQAPRTAVTAEGPYVEVHANLRPVAQSGAPVAPEAAVVLVAGNGERFSVQTGEGEHTWEFEGSAVALESGQFGISGVLRYNGQMQMTSKESTLAPGEALFLRKGADAAGNGAVLELTLWPADGSGKPSLDRSLGKRVHGRVQIRRGGETDTSFFDYGAVPVNAVFVPEFDAGLSLQYSITNVTDTAGTVSATITQRNDDGVSTVLANPTLMMARGEDAAIRIGMAEVAAAKTSILGLDPTTIDRGATTSVTLGGETWNPGDIELIFTLDAP